jgi:hypothetical protein
MGSIKRFILLTEKEVLITLDCHLSKSHRHSNSLKLNQSLKFPNRNIGKLIGKLRGLHSGGDVVFFYFVSNGSLGDTQEFGSPKFDPVGLFQCIKDFLSLELRHLMK